MISLPSGTRIWLVAGVTDMRKSFNGLGEQVQHVLNDNPFSGHLFIFRGRRGVELSRALLSNWVDACCQLMTPLNDALYRYVMNTRKVHTDDTPVKVLAPNHQGKHPEQHLRPFRGILQADAFNGYDRLFSAGREGGALTEAGCWAHARRKIHDVYISTKSATAEEALKLIGELYAIEHDIRGLPVSERLAVRQMQSRPLLTSLYKLMQVSTPRLLAVTVLYHWR
ncbi:hypothetical protein ESCOMA231M_24035 [Escherichia coli]|nr:truncated transposase [Escherichia coli]CAD5750227.1 truncated transposase [Escherichia coli]